MKSELISKYLERILLAVLFVSIFISMFSHYFAHQSVLSFVCSAMALIIISKILGEATEQLTTYLGQGLAGLLNVTLSNLAELIIIFAAVREGLIELVQAGIVGSIVGNLLLVFGTSIYIGCRKHGTLHFNEDVGTLFINQFLLVAAAIFMPTIFDRLHTGEAHQDYSNLLAIILVLVYLYFYRLELKDKRFEIIKEQATDIKQRWSKKKSMIILVTCALGAFVESEILVGEVENVAESLNISQRFIGFIMLPLLGNIAEHFVAITAAYKKMTDLSLSIAVGSATQVGMVVAPAAVLFGIITGHAVTLQFEAVPLSLLILSLVSAFVVLRDNKWNINEGVSLVVIYVLILIGFLFA